MAETSCNPSDRLHQDRAPPPLESETTARSRNVEERTAATETRGKGEEHGRKTRADHRMLPPEILET